MVPDTKPTTGRHKEGRVSGLFTGITSMYVLRMPQVVAATGLSRMTIYRLEKRGQFPSRIQLSPNSIGWRKDEVDHWIESLPKAIAPAGVVTGSGLRDRENHLSTRS
jgi:prophage regulatory protein